LRVAREISRHLPNRRNVLALLAGGGAAVLSPAVARSEASARTGFRCYVDANNGNDNHDGRSASTALKTLAALAKLPSRPTWIGLARNSRFSGSLIVGSQSIEAYGDGAPPIVDASVELSGDGWQQVNEFTWAYSRKLTWVEQVLFDDAKGLKKPTLAAEDAPKTWAWVGNTVHIRSAESPARAFQRIQAISSSCFHILRGDGAKIHGIVAMHGVHGFLGQHSRRVTISDCSALQCAANGFFLADNTEQWSLDNCFADQNGACGFAFNYGAAHSTISRSRGTRNGIDGCQFSEGCGTGNVLTDCEFSRNAIGGVNCKEKNQKALRCRLEHNGEAGAVAQINTDLFEISDSVFIRNNQSDNGTMNLALEDHARVDSNRNIFISAQGRAKPAVNVRLIGRSALNSVADVFIDADRGNNAIASILVHTSEAASLSLIHASIYNRTRAAGGRVIDCRNASNITLKVCNTAIVGEGPSLTYDAHCKVTAENNCFHALNGGPLIEVSGTVTRFIGRDALHTWAAADKSQAGNIAADPGFINPTALDMTLGSGSPARRAGKPGYARADVLGAPYGTPPHIGAVAERGDLRTRVKL
jgi:hypothetical protein